MSERHFHKFLAVYLLVIHIGLSLSCERANAVATTQAIEVIEWDFSDGGTELAKIKTPWTSPQEVLYIHGRKRLTLKIRNALSGILEFDMAQVWREQGRDNVRIVSFFTDPGTVDEVYATAMRLADAWQIKERDNIERFRKTSGRTLMRDESVIVQDQADPVQPRWIEIRQSFAGNGKNWLVIFNVGFPKLDKVK